MNYLIDTDIVIYSIKKHEKVSERFILYKDMPKSLSVITYGELIYGARKSKNVEKNLTNVHKLTELFPIIDISPLIMEKFGELKASLERSGMVIDDMDLLIASTALTHNLILVTNNQRHFSRIEDLKIENWSK